MEFYMMQRRETSQIKAGSLLIGGGAPVSVQSMTNRPIDDIEGTVAQIEALALRGASLVRLALLTVDSAECLKKILPRVRVPLCADIHFDYRIALAALEAGVHKIRINPGNIGSAERTREVVLAAKDRTVPIRIGVNGGSIDRAKYSSPTPEALVDSAMGHVRILEDLAFTDIAVSIKASDLRSTVDANRIFASQRSYPLHLGLTEAGYGLASVVQSSIAIGSLLMEGIGDTIRVSMTGDPFDEIDAGQEILKSLGLISHGIRIIACPTCGRTDPTIDLRAIAEEVDIALRSRFSARLALSGRMLSVAVMGCEVNGPGEASHADVGIAGARGGNFMLFAHGEKIGKIPSNRIVEELASEIEKLLS
jgi:(E)-4-hydroxy-3-methylbut-2-enyl-diphosphate synthase